MVHSYKEVLINSHHGRLPALIEYRLILRTVEHFPFFNSQVIKCLVQLFIQGLSEAWGGGGWEG